MAAAPFVFVCAVPLPMPVPLGCALPLGGRWMGTAVDGVGTFAGIAIAVAVLVLASCPGAGCARGGESALPSTATTSLFHSAECVYCRRSCDGRVLLRRESEGRSRMLWSSAGGALGPGDGDDGGVENVSLSPIAAGENSAACRACIIFYGGL